MQIFIYFIIGFLVGYVVGGGLKEDDDEKTKRDFSAKKDDINSVGRESSSKGKTVQKNEEKILKLFDKKKEISNDDVEKLLKVSDSTATRYLKRMVKEGEIKQQGKRGKYVTYIK